MLATAVAAQTCLQVLAFLDGGTPAPPAVDGTLEVSLADGAVRRRSWSVHPSCGCGWPATPGPVDGRVSVWQTAGVEDLPRRAAARTVKLAGLPLGYAGRATLGLGKRLGGRPAEVVAAEVQARTAEQLFKVLGELKGGAMKFGQAMSVFEAALPENLAGPYRETLTRLQESAPPLPARTVHTVLVPRARHPAGGTGSSPSRTGPRRPPRSGRCTARCGPTAATSRSRCSTRAPVTRCSPT